MQPMQRLFSGGTTFEVCLGNLVLNECSLLRGAIPPDVSRLLDDHFLPLCVTGLQTNSCMERHKDP